MIVRANNMCDFAGQINTCQMAVKLLVGVWVESNFGNVLVRLERKIAFYVPLCGHFEYICHTPRSRSHQRSQMHESRSKTEADAAQ